MANIFDQFDAQSSLPPQGGNVFDQFDAPSAPNLLSRMGSDIANRLAEGAQSERDYQAGKISLPESMLQTVGKVIGGSAGDVMGETAKEIIPQAVTNAASSGAQSIADTLDNTQSGQAIGNIAMRTGQGYDKLDPQTKKTAESIADLANIPAAVGLANGSANLVGKMMDIPDIGTNLPGILGDTSGAPKTLAPITQQNVKTAAGNAYKFVENSGTSFAPTLTDKILNIFDNGKQSPIAGKVLTGEAKDINGALGEFDALKGSPLSITDFQQIDSNLGDKAAQAYVSGNANKARIISNAQDEMRSLVKPGNLASADLVGPQEGIDALTQDAIPLWSTQAKMADIQKIVDRANMMDNPSTGIKTGFRNLALNSGRMAQYPPDVQKLILKAAKTGVADDVLGILGSRLNAIAGAAVGGVPGSILSNATSMGARALRTSAKIEQAQKVSDALVKGVRPQIAKYANGVPPIPVPLPPSPSSLYPNLATHPLYSNLGLKNAMQLPPAQARVVLRMSKP